MESDTRPHAQDPVPLDGPLERARFAPPVTIVVALVAGFLAFQGISLLALLAMLAAAGDLTGLAGLTPAALVETYAREFLVANTIGQVIGLLLFAWGVARLHTTRVGRFLRIRPADPALTGLSLVGLAALVPIVQWLGTVMERVPWPEVIRSFEQVQLELIERVLASDLGIGLTLATMALTPAICEEVFFRGYIQTQAERASRHWLTAVVITGVVFGLYHLRITQAVPLSILGIYISYVVWRSDSLVPGVLVHFANNGLAVAVGAWVAARDDVSAADIESMEVPAYILVVAATLLAGTLLAMHRLGERRVSAVGFDHSRQPSQTEHGNDEAV